MLFQPLFSTTTPGKRRPAIVLLVVIALLTIFAAAAVAFVFYANAESTSSKYFREATVNFQPDADPEMMFAFFLQQLMYGVKDDDTGVYSAMRGHDLFRNTYGLNYTMLPGGTVVLGNNTVLFDGTGRLNYPHAKTAPPILANQLDLPLINYTYYPLDGFVRDPERLGFRTSLTTPAGQYFRSANPSYSYPDLNTMFLAAVKSDGTVLMPSFHRHYLFNPTATLDNPNPSANPNWYIPIGKYKILRPRPQENPGFPFPESAGGDVQNLHGGPGYYDPITRKLYPHDSIWMSLGAPIFRAPDGRKYTFLFAPLIIDLDGKINVNVAGNKNGALNTQVTNMGMGPWEQSLAESLNADAVGTGLGTEWTRLFMGYTVTVPPKTFLQKMGRYGPDGFPYDVKTGKVALPGIPSHFYAKLDLDAMRSDKTPSLPLPLPTGTNCFPNFAALPGPGYGYDDGSLAERTYIPLLYNLLNPAWLSNTQFNRRFAPSNMEMLLRYGGTGTEAFTSELMYLCPTNFANPAIRGRVTTDSWDLHVPGVMPWVYLAPGTQPYQLPPGSAPGTPPSALTTSISPLPSLPSPPLPDPPVNRSDFSSDWGGATAALGRLDLNRPLPRYPTPAANGRITDLTGYAIAQDARQQFAADIFKRLCAVTGAGDPTDTTINTPPTLKTLPKGAPPAIPAAWNAYRYLAQLAANIVDYIDNDDYMTRFQWYTPPTAGPYASAAPEWVFGTELPRVLINEAYTEYTPAGKDVNVNCYLELYNPFTTDLTMGKLISGGVDVGSDSDNGAARLEMPPTSPKAKDGYGIYQVVISKDFSQNPNWGDPTNVTGQPDFNLPPTANFLYNSPGLNSGNTVALPDQIPPVPPGKPITTPSSLASIIIYPSNGAASGPNGGNQGYLLVGATPTVPDGTTTSPQVTLQSSSMNFTIKNTTTLKNATFALQRLACPRLPPNSTSNNPDGTPNPLYNPYITVDYTPSVPAFLNTATNKTASGRQQPYVGGIMPPQTTTAKKPPQIVHTFFKSNTPITNPFTWLTHLDRQLISPMELLQVSGVPPYHLTYTFNGATGLAAATDKHYAPWITNLPARLYRAFELLGTRSLAAGFSVPPSTTLRTRIIAKTGAPGTPNPATLFSFTPTNSGGVTPAGVPWNINVGDTLIFDLGAINQENVTIVDTPPGFPKLAPGNFYGYFRNNHNAGATITLTTLAERIPGKININTIWDPEIFRALCPPSPSINMAGPGVNRTLLVDNMFYNPPVPPKVGAKPISVTLLDSRSPKSVPMTNPQYWSQPYLPGPTDVAVPGYPLNRPFRSLATGTVPASATDTLFPGGVGINDTLFRIGPTGTAPLFSIPPSATVKHPYQLDQVLTSLFNNVTTRSNVFAVWVTIGCFEVVQDTDALGNPIRPVKLGAEIGRTTGQNVRHQMFAIVDRSKLIANTTYTTNPNPRVLAASPLPQTVNVLSTAGIQVGSLVTFDWNSGDPKKMETVMVTAVTQPAGAAPGSFSAVFTKPHGAGANAPIYVYAPPGPLTYTPPTATGTAPLMTNTFNPHAHPAVLYFSIIN
jgi:hypothetical protein